MKQAVWQTEPGGVLSCELGEFRLVVERSNGWVRYTVHRRRDSSDVSSPTLIASGNKDDAHAAMTAAESIAESHAATKQANDADPGHHGPARDHAA